MLLTRPGPMFCCSRVRVISDCQAESLALGLIPHAAPRRRFRLTPHGHHACRSGTDAPHPRPRSRWMSPQGPETDVRKRILDAAEAHLFAGRGHGAAAPLEEIAAPCRHRQADALLLLRQQGGGGAGQSSNARRLRHGVAIHQRFRSEPGPRGPLATRCRASRSSRPPTSHCPARARRARSWMEGPTSPEARARRALGAAVRYRHRRGGAQHGARHLPRG